MPYPYKFEKTLVGGAIVLTPSSHDLKKKLNLDQIKIWPKVCLIELTKFHDKESRLSTVSALIDRDKENKQFVSLYHGVSYIYFFWADKYKCNQLMMDFVDCLDQSIPLTPSFIGELKESLQDKGYNFFNKEKPSSFDASKYPLDLSISTGTNLWIEISDPEEKELGEKDVKTPNLLSLKEIVVDRKGNKDLTAPNTFSPIKIIDPIINAFLKGNEDYSQLVFKDENGKNASILLGSFDLTDTQKKQIVTHLIEAFIGTITLSSKAIHELKDKLLKNVFFDVAYKETDEVVSDATNIATGEVSNAVIYKRSINYFNSSCPIHYSLFNTGTHFQFVSSADENISLKL